MSTIISLVVMGTIFLAVLILAVYLSIKLSKFFIATINYCLKSISATFRNFATGTKNFVLVVISTCSKILNSFNEKRIQSKQSKASSYTEEVVCEFEEEPSEPEPVLCDPIPDSWDVAYKEYLSVPTYIRNGRQENIFYSFS